MCGICGLVKRETPVARQTLAEMTATMVHRGPDEAGMWTDARVGLGVRRLAILDVRNGHQPLFDERGDVVAVANGEIYNFKDLRREAEAAGHTMASQADTEVIPHLYEMYGADFVTRLRGMFAIALFDRRTGRLYLMRDPFGIKPLYYALTDETLAFGSEIHAVLASGVVTPTLDLQALWHDLTFQYVPEPRTMFAGVQKLPPASILTLDTVRHTAHVTRYAELALAPDSALRLAETAPEILARLRESVRLHLQSDVPVGAYLSSGVDSSSIVALMREERADVHTFSVAFEGAQGASDELAGASYTARLLGTRHHPVHVTAHAYMEAWPHMVRHQEEPVADPSAGALYFLAQAARAYVTVVLSGEGADELFAGYPIYAEPGALWPFRFVPRPVRRRLRTWAEALPEGLRGRGYIVRGTTDLEERFVGNSKMFSEDAKRMLVRVAATSPLEDAMAITGPWYRATEHLDPVARMQTVDLHTWLAGDILMKADKMSMAHSIELRVPFLDREVFAVASRLPAHLKIAHGTTKYALRQAVRPILPPEVALRPKLGFPMPIRQWLRTDMRDFAYDTVRGSGLDALLDMAYVERMLDRHMAGEGNFARRIWTVLTLALWYTHVFRGRMTTSRIWETGP